MAPGSPGYAPERRIPGLLLTKEQEWREGLRSSLHPLLFAGIYKAASQLSDILGLRISLRAEVLLASPKLVQAVFAAAMDFFTYKLAVKTYSPQSAAPYTTLLLTLASPWQAFCSVRTLSNSVETALTIVALYFWPWSWFANESIPAGRTDQKQMKNVTSQSSQDHSLDLHKSLAAAALACILRPTNIIVWATISLTLLIRSGSIKKLLTLAQAAVLSGGAVLAVSVSADNAFYGEWILPPLRFLQFNLVQSLAVFYGKNRPDYYLTEGLPLLLTTALPFAAIGLWQALRTRPTSSAGHETRGRTIKFTLAVAVVSSVSILSLISHKEMRFIYPLLPMLHMLGSQSLAKFFAPFPRPTANVKRALLILMIGVNIFIGWYTLFVHQRGVIDVLHELRKRHEEDISALGSPPMGKRITTVGFLMPCHSTPWRSHLVHSGIHAWALTCEPPLTLTMEERETYMDEADVFYDSPLHWISQNMGDRFPDSRPWPQYLVFFEQLEPIVSPLISGDYPDYEEVWRGFNTHWHDDSRRKGDVLMWRRVDPAI